MFLFNKNGTMNIEQLEHCLNEMDDVTCEELLKAKDVDHYSLLDKAVIYDSLELAEIILGKTFAKKVDPELFKDTLHLASFVGSSEIVELLCKHHPRAAEVSGCARIHPVAGSNQHQLTEYTAMNTGISKERLILHWLSTHPGESPIYYAVCGDQYQVLHTLLNNMEHENHDVIKQLLSVACSCGSFVCMEWLSHKLPDGLGTRDARGHLIISRGNLHGPSFLEILKHCQFDFNQFNDIDKNGTNILHFFYNSLSQNDQCYNKYNYIDEMTSQLICCGIDVNQMTSSHTSHSCKETPLHIVLSQLNLVVSSDPSQYIKSTTRNKLQRQYDKAILTSIDIILENGFDLEKHCKTVIQKLFENRNFWNRLKICSKIKDLTYHGYGLRNVYIAASKLFRHGSRLHYGRRDMTPLLAFIDGFRVTDNSFDILTGEAGSVYVSCVKLMLSNGINPNAYVLRPDEDCRYAVPLIHLLNLFSAQWIQVDANIADTAIDRMVEIVELLCEYGSVFLCSKYVQQRYLKYGVFDALMSLLTPIFHRASVEYCAKSLAVLNKLIITLLQWGAEAIFFQNVEVQLSGLPCWHSFKEPLVIQWLHFSTYIDHYHICDHPDYQRTLLALLNLSDSSTYYGCLTENTSISILQGTHKFFHELQNLGRTARSLRHLCRRIIYVQLQTQYKHQVSLLPLPALMQQYLLSFE